MNKLFLILAAGLIAGCGEPTTSEVGAQRAFGPDDHGVLCYTYNGPGISCVQVQEGRD